MEIDSGVNLEEDLRIQSPQQGSKSHAQLPQSTASGKSIKDRNLLSGSLSLKLRQSQRARSRSKDRRTLVKNHVTCHQAWGPNDEDNKSTSHQRKRSNSNGLYKFPSLRSKNSSQRVRIRAPNNFDMDSDALSDLMATDNACYKAALDAVAVQNVGGVFLPRDKYSLGRFTMHARHSPTPSGESFLLRPDGTWHRPDRPSRKILYDSRSAKSDGALLEKGPRSSDKLGTSSTSRATRKDNSSQQRARFEAKRFKVDQVGVKWKLNDETRDKYLPKSVQGRVSKNVLPVTIGVDHRGTSVTRTKWLVPTMQDHEPTQVWLKGLNFIKQPVLEELRKNARISTLKV